MAYVAVKGGKEAIDNAEQFFQYQRMVGDEPQLKEDQIEHQLSFLVDKILSEGSLYAPKLAAQACLQAQGDPLEASFILRAYRTTKSRLGYSIPQSASEMRIIRRISAGFKDIPGGQILGPTPDYTLRLLDFDTSISQQERETIKRELRESFSAQEFEKEDCPKMIQILREEGLLVEADDILNDNDRELTDVTRKALTFPVNRSAMLQTMAMGETGALLAFAYGNMRGDGDDHPVVGELRVGYLPIKVEHPYTKEEIIIGEIKVTEVEIIAKYEACKGRPKFTLGYGLCFGYNETKAISMGVLDRAIQSKKDDYKRNQEIILSHIDGINSMGFANHYKLPHYVTFQSELDRLRRTQNKYDAEKEQKRFQRKSY